MSNNSDVMDFEFTLVSKWIEIVKWLKYIFYSFWSNICFHFEDFRSHFFLV